MNWIYAALTGLITGWVVFIPIWALLARWGASTANGKVLPRPVMLAMSIAFVMIALSSFGFFRGAVSQAPPDEYEQGSP